MVASSTSVTAPSCCPAQHPSLTATCSVVDCRVQIFRTNWQPMSHFKFLHLQGRLKLAADFLIGYPIHTKEEIADRDIRYAVVCLSYSWPWPFWSTRTHAYGICISFFLLVFPSAYPSSSKDVRSAPPDRPIPRLFPFRQLIVAHVFVCGRQQQVCPDNFEKSSAD